MQVSLLKDQQFYLRCFVFVLVGAWCVSFIGAAIDPYGNYAKALFCWCGGSYCLSCDFASTTSYSAWLDPYFHVHDGFKREPYPPFIYFVMWPFARLATAEGMHSWMTRGAPTSLAASTAVLWMVFITVCCFYALNLLRRKHFLPRSVLLGFLFSLAYFHCCLGSANTIFLSAACIFLFVCFYDSKDKKERFWAILALACAAAIKIWPALFGLLYLPQKRYKDAFLSAVFTLVLGFGPFFFLKGHFSDNFVELLHFAERVSDFFSTFSIYSVLHPFERFFSCSIISARNAHKIDLCLGGLAALCIFFQTDTWKRLTLVSLGFLFAPSIHWYYCYPYMFPSMMLFFATLPTRRGITNIAILTLFVSGMLPFPVAYADLNRVLPLSALNMLLLLGYLLISTARDVLRGRSSCLSCQEHY